MKFLRQAPLGAYIADFVCRERRLVVEVDGDSHADRAHYDAKRARTIESLGYRIVRVPNDEVLSNVEGVLASIVTAAGIDVERWRAGELGQIELNE